MANAHSALRAERAGKIETRMISPAKLGDKPFVAIARVWLEFSQTIASSTCENSTFSCSRGSRPTDTRISSSRIPTFARCSAVIKRWEVVAGCEIVVRASARVGENGIPDAACMNRFTTEKPSPASSRARIPPVPSGDTDDSQWLGLDAQQAADGGLFGRPDASKVHGPVPELSGRSVSSAAAKSADLAGKATIQTGSRSARRCWRSRSSFGSEISAPRQLPA
jgi:hypothetical protein